MKRTIVALAAIAMMAAFVLGGCASTDPIWFIATPGFVEAQIMASEGALQADYEEKLAERDARIEKLESELAAQQAVAEELRALVGDISRIDLLPTETLRLLVDVLDDYLRENAPR